jgi:hypothetical protein
MPFRPIIPTFFQACVYPLIELLVAIAARTELRVLSSHDDIVVPLEGDTYLCEGIPVFIVIGGDKRNVLQTIEYEGGLETSITIKMPVIAYSEGHEVAVVCVCAGSKGCSREKGFKLLS